MIKAVLNELQQMKKENPSLLLAANAEHEGVDSIIEELTITHSFVLYQSIYIFIATNLVL
jgi:hypothetical protein